MKPDALFWQVDHQPEEGDNRDQVMLLAECFRPSRTKASADIPCQMSQPSESITVNGDGPSQVTIEGEGATFLQWIRDCADQEDSVVQALKELHGGKGLHHEEWREKDGLVLYRGRVYVPPDGQLRHDLINAFHDSPITGHSGRWKTTDLVARNFWWLGMGHYIAEYTKGCDLCNCTQNYPSTLAGKLMPNCIPDRCWQTILVDLITELL